MPAAGRSLLAAGTVLAVSLSVAEGSPTCAARLDALQHCTPRIAAQTACSLEGLLSNGTVRSILGCTNTSLLDCSHKCLDTLGLLGLPVNSSSATCTAAEQLMVQKSGKVNLLINFVPSASGLPKPSLIPAGLASLSSGFPHFAYFGDYQGCMLGSGNQYCLVDGKLDLRGFKTNALLGLCRPAECSEEEIHTDAASLVKQMQVNDFQVSCHKLEEAAPPMVWTNERIVALTLFVAIAVLLGLATARDLQKRWRAQAVLALDAAPLCEGRPQPASMMGPPSVANAFSLVRNADSFSKVRPQDPKGPALDVLDGLRVLSTLWVILGHVVIWPLLSVQYEESGMILPPSGRLTEWWFQIVPGGYFAVDTFFWLSGFLGAHTLHEKVKRSPQLLSLKAFSLKLYPMGLLNRWLRLTIVYAFVLLFTQTWYRPIGRSGPLWDADTSLVGASGCIGSIDNAKCKQAFWTNLLYINNLVSGDKNACMLWTWYLACDMQMFLILPFIVLFRERGGKAFGWLVLTVLLFTSIIACGTTIWNEELVTDPVLGSAKGRFMKDVYEVSWMRVQPYLIGIGCAWILSVLEEQRDRARAPALAADAVIDQEAPAPQPVAQSGAAVAPVPQNTAHQALLANAAEATVPKALGTTLTSTGTDDVTVRSQPANGSERRASRPSARWVALAVGLQLLSFVLMCFVVFIPATRYRCKAFIDCTDVHRAPWSPTVNMLYGALNHALWGLGLGCLMLLCFVRAPGTWWVSTLLGAEFWQKPAKLSYAAYLVHPLVLVLFYCQRIRSVQYLDSNLVSNFTAFAVIVFLVSLVVWFAVEKPAANLTAQFMGALGGGSQRSETAQN